MTSKYIKCEECPSVIDRMPIAISKGDGCFHSGPAIRDYAESIGWQCFADFRFSYNGGYDYCPDHIPRVE